MKTHLRKVSFAVLVLSLVTSVSMADGLKTTFGKVDLGNVPMDTEYSMRKDAKFPLVVESKNDYGIQLKVEVVKPLPGEVQEGYEAIPDAGWITLEKDFFTLEPFGKAETDIKIKIPKDKKYAGKKYHVFIWSHVIGESLGFGVNSKLLINVSNDDTENVAK